jgi:PAS domain S-box-containing protein
MASKSSNNPAAVNMDSPDVSAFFPGNRESSAAEEKLHEYESRFRLVVEKCPQGILIHQDNKVVFANTAVAEMYGYASASDLLGRDVFETFAAPEERPLLYNRTAAAYRGEKLPPHPGYRGLRRDGTSVWVMANASVLSWKGRPAIIAFYTEVTQFRATELALRESEARFRTLVEHAPEAIVVLDVDTGVFVDVNDNACELFGMPRERLLHIGPIELSPPSQPDGTDSESLSNTIIHQAAEGRVLRFEWVYRNARGEDIPCEVRLVRLPSHARRLVRGSILNIAERKRMEHRDRMRREILERMAKGHPLPAILESIVALVEYDSPRAIGSILLLDESGQKLLHGAAPRLPDFYNQMVHGLSIGPGVGSCGTAAFTGKRVVVEDVTTHPYWRDFRAVAEKIGVCACWSEPILSSTGRVLGTFAIYRSEPSLPSDADLESISIAANLASIAIERRRAEESLRVSEERLRLAAEAARFGTYDRDLVSNVRVWSPALREMFGFTPSDPINDETIQARIHPDDRGAANAAIQAGSDPAGQGEFTLQHRVVRPDGTVRWIEVMGRTLVEGEGVSRRPVRSVGVAMDVTARKQQEEEQRKFQTQLQHAQKLESLGVMAGGIAHDFNNLLTGILGYSDLARRALPEDSLVRGYLEEVVKGARQASELTQQMLAYSGRGRLHVQPLSLTSLVEDMARLLEISISKKALLRFVLERDIPSCEADAAQLRQVVMNLVINASEAIGERGGTITVSTGLMHCNRAYLQDPLLDADLPEGPYVYLEVADTGHGMTDEVRSKIFDPFFTTKFTGRGLGLAAVLGIVRGHRAAFKVNTELGKGTSFRIVLPASKLAPLVVQQSERMASDWRGSGVVMVVDDEQSVRAIARAMLELLGFTVLVAENGRQAVDVFRQSSDAVRLVLLDMTMPELDGEETLRELLRIRPDVRAILSSGYNEQSVAGNFLGLHVAAFLQKPYRFDSLREVVRKCLGE